MGHLLVETSYYNEVECFKGIALLGPFESSDQAETVALLFPEIEAVLQNNTSYEPLFYLESFKAYPSGIGLLTSFEELMERDSLAQLIKGEEELLRVLIPPKGRRAREREERIIAYRKKLEVIDAILAQIKSLGVPPKGAPL